MADFWVQHKSWLLPTVISVGSFAGACGLTLFTQWLLRTRYKLTPQQQQEAKKEKIAVIGAGISGICIVEG